MNKKLKSIPKLSVSLTNHFDPPALPGNITCDSSNHTLKDITSKYTETNISLGQGAFKSALLVKHNETGEYFVAFDFPHPKSSSSIKEICNFIRIFYNKLEKNSEQCLKNVLCPVDIGFVNQNVRFVTDYFKGVNLETWLENNKCQEGYDDIKLTIMIKLIDALDDLHSKWNYTHHDIKPANIMISVSEHEPEVAIIDIFGGCFDNQEDCNPMTDEKYRHIIDEVEYTNADPDMYAMSKVFKDLIGAKWSGETRGSFECKQDLNDFEQKIYDLSEQMAMGALTINEIKNRLHHLK